MLICGCGSTTTVLDFEWVAKTYNVEFLRSLCFYASFAQQQKDKKYRSEYSQVTCAFVMTKAEQGV